MLALALASCTGVTQLAMLDSQDAVGIETAAEMDKSGALEKMIATQVTKVASKEAKKAMRGVRKKAKTEAAKVQPAPESAPAVQIAAKYETKQNIKRNLRKKLQNRELRRPLQPLTVQKKLLKLSGCRDMARFKELCKAKKALCKDKRFGSTVQKQCPATCGICERSPPKTSIKVSCNPKPLVKKLSPKLMKASSSLGKGREAYKAQLHSLKTPWVAGRQRKGQWLQISLPQEMTITSIATQGRYNGNQWVSYYKLMHKKKHWRWYSGGKWMRGNWDRTHTRKHVLTPFKARYLRFYPQKWHHKISMRVEVWGCVEKKEMVAPDAIAKTLAKHVSKVVDKRVTLAAATALRAVKKATVNEHAVSNKKLKKLVSNAVHMATTAASREIRSTVTNRKDKALIRQQLSSTSKHVKIATENAVDAAVAAAALQRKLAKTPTQ